MENRRNYYRILHVQPDAPLEIIKTSYRTLLQKLKQHPDLGGSHWNAVLINDAYQVLSSNEKRALYDRHLLQDYFQHFRSTTTDTHQFLLPHEKKIKHYCPFCKTPYFESTHNRNFTECLECNSPLIKIVARDVAYHERQLKRFHKDGMVELYTYWPQQGIMSELNNISVQGAAIITAISVEDDHIVKLDSDWFKATGRVIYCRDLASDPASADSFLLGIEFCTLSFIQKQGNFVVVDV